MFSQTAIIISAFCLSFSLLAHQHQSAEMRVTALPDGIQESTYLSNIIQVSQIGLRSGEGYFNADGSSMIYQSEEEPGNPFYQIYLHDLKSGQVSRISNGIGKTTCAWFHPNQSLALFSSTHLDPNIDEKVSAEYKRRETGRKKEYSWSYDENYDVFAYDLEGREIKRLTHDQGYDAEASYSPDGQHILFASNKLAYQTELTPEEQQILAHNPSYFIDLFIMKADGSEVQQLTTSTGYDGGPFFNADGSKITWRRFSPDPKVYEAEIYVMNRDGSQQKALTAMKTVSWAPFFHPSGEYIIFTTAINGHQNFEIYIVDTEGTHEPVRITYTMGADVLPVFTPDGSQLSWTSQRGDGSTQIFMGEWNHAAARHSLGLNKK